MKIKFFVSGGKSVKISSTKIPYVIFSDHKRYWNVFKPVCDEFERRGIDIVYWTESPDDPALNAKYEHVKTEFIGDGNKAYARLNMMNAGIIENPVNPFTGKLINNNEKTKHPQLVTSSQHWQTETNCGATFDTSDGHWFSVHDDIFKEENWKQLD